MTMTPTTRCSHPYIDDYIYRIRRGDIPASKEIHLACDYVEDKLSEPGINIDVDKIDKAVELIERYFEFRLLDWELFVLALKIGRASCRERVSSAAKTGETKVTRLR